MSQIVYNVVFHDHIKSEIPNQLLRKGHMNILCIVETNNRQYFIFFYVHSLLVLLQSCMMLTGIKKYLVSAPLNRQENKYYR